MKLKTTIAALFVGIIPLVSAQDAPAKEPAAEEAAKEVKPEGPLEEQAFKIFDLVSTLPGILASIQDDASLAAAEKKMEALDKKLDAEAVELKKLPVPSNEARKKLNAKMKSKEEPMQKEMENLMVKMSSLDQALAEKIGQSLMGFSMKMQKLAPTMDKYFKPDDEAEGE